MMSLPLLMATFKKNWLLWVIFFGVLIMYLAVMISMYDPNDMAALTTMLQLMPENIMKAFGYSELVTDLTGYLASWLYSLLMLGFPMVYCIMLANRLVAKMVDNGSFAYLLSTPNSRTKIIVTQAFYAFLSLTVLFAAIYLAGVLICQAAFPGLLDKAAFFTLNLTTLLVNMSVMMICFFFSCLFNDAKLSLGFGSAIPIAFLLMNMLGGVSDQSAWLKNFTIYGLYNPVELVRGKDVLGLDMVYIVMIVVFFGLGVIIFKRKRLPL